ncbi:MAG: PAS-domain containing protein [Paracoccaceae bacterium]
MIVFRPLALALTGTSDPLNVVPTVAVAAGASLAVSVLLLTLVRLAGANSAAAAARSGPQSHGCRVENGRLHPLSPAAGEYLDALADAADASPTEALVAACPDLARAFESLEAAGTCFRREVSFPGDLALEIAGRPSGSRALVTISELTTERRTLLDLKERLQRANRRTDEMIAALQDAPVAVWQTAGDGALSWCNTAFRQLAADTGLPEATLASRVADGCPADEAAAPARVELAAAGGTRSVDAVCNGLRSGGKVGCAADVTPLADAEAALARFVETLTVTFAHLPTGLAIFDSDRRLGMFNPALGDLLKLDPAWLARSPSLREFLEHLRENRQMPDQKDFISWRRRLTDLEEGARDGSYDEIWVLPSGRNLRVSGRPHPRGALAFLFEDISDAVRLEARRRADNALNRALMDRLPEAIGVFDASGRLAFFNAAFAAMWNLEAEVPETARNVVGMSGYWAAASDDPKLFARLRRFATSGAEREAWAAGLRLKDGRAVQCAVAPLPDSSTLTVFAMTGSGGAKAMGKARANREEPAVDDENAMDAGQFFDGLEDILLPGGVRLRTAGWHLTADAPPGRRALRRIAWNMILAAIELAPDASSISVSGEVSRGQTTLRVLPAGGKPGAKPGAGGGIALRVLRHFIAGQCGELSIDGTAARELVCRLPAPSAAGSHPDEQTAASAAGP